MELIEKLKAVEKRPNFMRGVDAPAMLEAAAEIERLKAELKNVQALYDVGVERANAQARTILQQDAQLAEAHAALEVMVEQEVEYMEINNLGDPEQQHGIIMARKALTTDGKAAADVLEAGDRLDKAYADATTGGFTAGRPLQVAIHEFRDAVRAYRKEGRDDDTE